MLFSFFLDKGFWAFRNRRQQDRWLFFFFSLATEPSILTFTFNISMSRSAIHSLGNVTRLGAS